MVVADMFSGMLLQLETIGQMLGGFLWIFFQEIESGSSMNVWWGTEFEPCTLEKSFFFECF